MDTIFISPHTCPKCHKEFLIENAVPKKPGSEKKPSESVHANTGPDRLGHSQPFIPGSRSRQSMAFGSVNEASMHEIVAINTQCDQILLAIFTTVTPEFLVVDLQVIFAATVLAFPPVSRQDLYTEGCIGGSIQTY